MRMQGKNLESHPCFFAFGGGSRFCPGKELGVVEIAVFLHHFLTRYRYISIFFVFSVYHALFRALKLYEHSDCRWEEVGGGKLLKFPRVVAPKGMYVRVLDR